MVERVDAFIYGKTTMRIIPSSVVKEASEEFSEALHTASKEVKAEKEVELDTIFEQASSEYGVPLYLLKAVAKAESGFNTDSVSRSGAMGVMQLMPETAKELGVSDAFDPEENIMGGAQYLAQKLTEYKGDVELALAAYNAGSANVAKYGGIPPFEETQNYVKKVTAYMEEYKQELGTVTTKTSDTKRVQSVSDAEVVNTTVSAYSANYAAMEAYERMKDETYWKVLK